MKSITSLLRSRLRRAPLAIRRRTSLLRWLLGNLLSLVLSLALRPLLTSLAPFRDPERPIRQHRDRNVENDESPDDAKVAPPLSVVDVRASQELVTILNRAIPAFRSCVRVLQQAWCSLEIVGKILLTGLASGRVKARGLGVGADDLAAVQKRRAHAADPVGEGRDAVHEYPEFGER